MSKKDRDNTKLGRARKAYNPAEWWCCEGCGSHHHGENPPDTCDVCGHTYFDNWADMTADGKQPDFSRPYRRPGELH